MEIRPAVHGDLDAIMEIYEHAKEFMRQTGNPTQWNGAYPSRELLSEDIRLGQCYVCSEPGGILGVFVFIIGPEPTYQYIENGSWTLDREYGAIHRIAMNGKVKGLAGECYEFCKKRISYIRADTHHDNKVMQKSLLRGGFKACGRIYVEDGSPRIAYEYIGGHGDE